MKKKILLLLASLFLALPCIVNAEVTLTLKSVQPCDNSSCYSTYTNLINSSIQNISFRGYRHSQTDSRVWPYNNIIFMLDSNVPVNGNSYNFNLLVNGSFLRSDGMSSFKFNTVNCTQVNYLGSTSFWNCPNVKINATGNKITYSFTNSGTSSSGWFYGLSNLTGTETNDTQEESLLKWIEYYSSNTNQLILDQQKEIISNQEKNKQEQIDNANQNSQNEIDNANKNTQQTVDTINDNFQSCHDSYNLFNKNSVTSNYAVYLSDGSLYSQNGLWNATDYIAIKPNQSYYFSNAVMVKSTHFGYAYYDKNKNFISSVAATASNNISFTVPNNSNIAYIRLSFRPTSDLNKMMLVEGTSAKPYEPYGEQVCSNRIDETNEALGDINNSITDSNVDTSSSNSFFGDFTNNDHGLSSIITAPLNFIKSLTSSSCSPLSLTIPFVNQTLNLPCMNTVYSNFNQLYTLYQTITFGIISYWVCVRIYALVKSFKDPEDDRIEVVDL